MSHRTHMIDDAAKHLLTDLREVFVRHMLLMKSAGASTVEGSAAACCAYESLGFIVLGATMATSADPRAGYLTSVDLLADNLRKRAGEAAQAVSQTQAKHGFGGWT